MSEKMSEMFALMQRAEKMEYVNESVAYDLYVKLFKEYEPQVSAPYEAAIRLYEKRGMLVEAHDIADRAIQMIQNNMMTAPVEKFEDIKKRLERKMAEQGISPLKKSDDGKFLKQVLLIFAIVLALFTILLFATPYGRVLIRLEEKEGSIGLDHEAMGVEAYKKYPITKKMIKYATNSVLRNDEVAVATIDVQSGKISMQLVVVKIEGSDVLVETDLALGEVFANELATHLGVAASKEYDDLDPPVEGELGELYDYYDVEVLVTSGDPDIDPYLHDVILAEGSLKKGAKTIRYWDDESIDSESNENKEEHLSE